MRLLVFLGRWTALGAFILVVGCPAPQPEPAGGTNSDGTGASNSTQIAGTDDLAAQFADCQPAANGDSWRAQVLVLVNQQRTTAGEATLVQNDTLEQQANEYACEMIHYDFFAHVNPVTGSTLPDRSQQFGYAYRVVGENLAAGQQSPEQVVTEWMNSPSHRANILDSRFTEVGVGLRAGGQYQYYWVLEFGLPLN
jgi:uncharacterized protein YkwD